MDGNKKLMINFNEIIFIIEINLTKQMTSENYSSVIIKAKEGFYITEVDDTIDITKRTIATAIALGTNDSADNYKEITADEANELKRLQDEARKEQIEAYRLEQEQKTAK